MKKAGYVVLILILLALFAKACIRADIQESVQKPAVQTSAVENINYPPPQKNVTLNGVDYLQSQAPAGKFGGTLVASTIGEGPKTFNPFNSKDNISTLLSEIMYDGLLSTNAVTGEPIPKLAKDFTVDGDTYLIHLR